ncbi:MAG: hypothetical protein R3F61_29990 [Myxococcota bacterium]
MYVRLPAKLRPFLDELRDRPLDPPDALRAQVEGHVKAAREAAAAGGPVDLKLAERLGKACLALLADFDRPIAEQRLIQAACHYFVDSDDEEGDFASMVGLEDDAHVMNYVLAQVGRDDLVLD